LFGSYKLFSHSIIGGLQSSPKLQDAIENRPTLFGSLKAALQTIGEAFALMRQEPEVIVLGFVKILLLFAFILLSIMSFLAFASVFNVLIPDQGDQAAIWGAHGFAFVCILPLFYLIAYMFGIMNGAIGAASYLYQTGQQSTLKRCLRISLQNAGNISLFMSMNFAVLLFSGSSKNDGFVSRSIKRAARFIWQVGSAGMMPALINGSNLKQAMERSIAFINHYPIKIVSIRVGFNAVVKLTMGGVLLLATFFAYQTHLNAAFASQYGFLFGTLGLVLLAFIPLIFRPVYILVVYLLYGKFLQDQKFPLEAEPTKAISNSVYVFLGLVLFYLLFSATVLLSLS